MTGCILYSSIGRNTDFSSARKRGIPFEGDYVGGGCIMQEIGMNAGERIISKKGEGKFAFGTAAEEFIAMEIEGVDDLGNRSTFKPQTRVSVENVYDAWLRHRGKRQSQASACRDRTRSVSILAGFFFQKLFASAIEDRPFFGRKARNASGGDFVE